MNFLLALSFTERPLYLATIAIAVLEIGANIAIFQAYLAKLGSRFLAWKMAAQTLMLFYIALSISFGAPALWHVCIALAAVLVDAWALWVIYQTVSHGVDLNSLEESPIPDSNKRGDHHFSGTLKYVPMFLLLFIIAAMIPIGYSVRVNSQAIDRDRMVESLFCANTSTLYASTQATIAILESRGPLTALEKHYLAVLKSSLPGFQNRFKTCASFNAK